MLRDSGTTRQGWLITMIEQPTLFGEMPGRCRSRRLVPRVASVSTWWGGATGRQRTGIAC